MKTVSENRSFGGTQGVYTHDSAVCGCDMTFGLYVPDMTDGPVPLVWYLSGLTCTHENAMVKSAAQGWASELGIGLIFPDTSPRGPGIPDDEAYDMGQGAGFYLDATEGVWARNFKMWSYLTDELPRLVFDNFGLDQDRQAITGHSMGGHGALTLAMSFPNRFASVSAFAPICNPTRSDWGRKQFTAYLGPDEGLWTAHDATLLMAELGFPGEVLVDQGTSDQFLDLLMPETLSAAMAVRRQAGIFRMQADYDHSYFFVSSFIGDHLRFHAEAMGR